MRKPEQYFCDMCGKMIERTKSHIDKAVPVVTNCEWEEGHPQEPYVVTLNMDLCKDCYIKAFNIKCGYRGADKQFIHEMEELEELDDLKSIKDEIEVWCQILKCMISEGERDCEKCEIACWCQAPFMTDRQLLEKSLSYIERLLLTCRSAEKAIQRLRIRAVGESLTRGLLEGIKRLHDDKETEADNG